MEDQLDAVDFAVAAYRDDGDWVVDELSLDHVEDVDALADALRRLPGESGALAMVGVDEDFFVIVRVTGGRTRVLLSDVTASDDWDLAASVLDLLDADDPDDDADPEPVGDLALLADLGVSAEVLEELLDDMLDDDDMLPDEVLSDVARLIGFGELFDDAVGLASA